MSSAGRPNAGRTASCPANAAKGVCADSSRLHGATAAETDRIDVLVTARVFRRWLVGVGYPGIWLVTTRRNGPPSGAAATGSYGLRVGTPEATCRHTARLDSRSAPARDPGGRRTGLAYGLGGGADPTTSEPRGRPASLRQRSGRFVRGRKRAGQAQGNPLSADTVPRTARGQPGSNACRARAGHSYRCGAGRMAAREPSRQQGKAACSLRATVRPLSSAGHGPYRRLGWPRRRRQAGEELSRARAPGCCSGESGSPASAVSGPEYGEPGDPTRLEPTDRAPALGDRVASHGSYHWRAGAFEAPTDIRTPSRPPRRPAERAGDVVRARRVRSRAGCRRCAKGP